MQVRRVTPDLSDRQLIAEHAQPKTINYHWRATFYGGLDRCVSRRRNSPGAARLRSASDGPMTAIVYFGEILVASLLAIVLLVPVGNLIRLASEAESRNVSIL
jgi:hypothetical protein